jgi:hypothetical protein
MGYCTGSGEENGDHCCYVGADEQGNQRVCPHLMDNAAMLAWIDAQSWSANKKSIARQYVTGIRWLCRVMVNTLADGNASLRNNRAQFEAAFLARPEYQEFPAPFWRQVEQQAGLPTGSLDCVKWQGESTSTGARTCCYRRTTAECDADAASRGITSAAVTIRKAGGRPD